MKEPQLPVSNLTAALPGASLQKACKFVVVFCSLHFCVVLIYYLSGADFGILQFFRQNQQSQLAYKQNYTISNATMRAISTKGRTKEPKEKLRNCPETSTLLVGPLQIVFSMHVDLEDIRKSNPDVIEGGHYRPKDCNALQKVAIIIPFRNRDEHLKYWLYYMHPILKRQQLDYGVYVINQDGDKTFNRAKLLNIGYVESLKDYAYDCFVFSDVDLIPMDDRNTYRCFNQPRHLSAAMDKFGFGLPYNQFFGGVSALSKEQFLKINGFPNNYWGWGGEDDDIYNRIASRGMYISRPDTLIGRCRMIRHNRDDKNDPNPKRFDLLAHTRQTMDSDGINTLSYKVVSTTRFPLYTYITVDIGLPH
ncbi:beta-1,4-galactosyltransferase 1 [Xenopus tropicalis]|uniref:Beta-1,4-galactosyltransferase n=1 Tax=Xenopus tropicalis TaxID=8364 RepID=Q28IP2_XENTR|nr:beta-1,4-galactosyltransferase 1 [Xenopus tropicalis]AAI70675.1 UDP-Gal:betaGlcNAc beta 1,4- galactosyltransferase, polypeptide 2 [Xenopus tropicalis]AAI70994.1 UDP-Gal:betaGlcNAc beta 1,4- galactosyltransferase, polypeptide 2 [Xenopus tropicalis]CAJ83025.1 UDP-Gal:betaGlcNAc beta 1,4-galactosyltransferase, polypeptide 1 [Xenopus tropicalis]|eukprot:NP_001016664.1 beta-1,4-galactosyltransferase 1 [Xenopus tropicalis]